MKTGPTCPGTMGPCPGVCPVRCGTVPEGSRDAPCAGLAPPGSVLPARIPLENCSRVGAGRFGGRWGRRGGRRAKAAPALEAPDYRRTKASTLPQVGCLYPGERLRAAQLSVGGWGCPFGGGVGTGECSARCIGGRLGARGAGVRFGNRPWPAGSAGALGRGAPKAPYPAIGCGSLFPAVGAAALPVRGAAGCSVSSPPGSGVWLTVPRL